MTAISPSTKLYLVDEIEYSTYTYAALIFKARHASMLSGQIHSKAHRSTFTHRKGRDQSAKALTIPVRDRLDKHKLLVEHSKGTRIIDRIVSLHVKGGISPRRNLMREHRIRRSRDCFKPVILE